MPNYQIISDNVATLAQLISYPSTSESATGRQQARQFVRDLLEKYCGATVEEVPSAGESALVATISGQTPATILFYGHYDVMTSGAREAWDSDPFTLTAREGRLFGRGAGDNKGQLIATIIGLNHFLVAHPNHRQTFQFLIEGEEEQGSIHLAEIVKKLRSSLLAKVQEVIVVDGSMSDSGDHVLRLANRGLFGFKLHLQTASQDNHSGNAGNVLANPVLLFQEVLNHLYDQKNKRVLIPHFYDGVEAPTKQDDADIAHLPFNRERLNQVFGGEVQAQDQEDYYHRLMFQPTFNVSGIQAGYTGPGVKTIIPASLTANINFRLVGHQQIAPIAAGLATVLQPWLDQGVLNYEINGQVPPATSPASPAERLRFQKAAQTAGISLLVEPCMPGTVPNYVWTDILGVKVFTLPLANFDQHNHSNNENITVTAFEQGIALITALAAQYESEVSPRDSN
ncbi:M20/M25/M40 family metallo-hydrolase [Lactobacillus sp. DCY120]|uniref:M20/M25/M40 family metallo-hydrolase n=1 Tax=Bombilactobacillus apium TaxID=2675299 RepID=A0A850QZM9_9LACO|nr:M20/M25/M40 family metallo-hydrolase [Bombilactobacillus apium]NVY96143.1 M20/M25/M40 family metallo-hydrolase [Bombilactobacillus apium]